MACLWPSKVTRLFTKKKKNSFISLSENLRGKTLTPPPTYVVRTYIICSVLQEEYPFLFGKYLFAKYSAKYLYSLQYAVSSQSKQLKQTINKNIKKSVTITLFGPTMQTGCHSVSALLASRNPIPQFPGQNPMVIWKKAIWKNMRSPMEEGQIEFSFLVLQKTGLLQWAGATYCQSTKCSYYNCLQKLVFILHYKLR